MVEALVRKSPRWIALAPFALSACIIPDTEIQAGSDIVNDHPVRIVEYLELPFCSGAQCPQPRQSLPSHFLSEQLGVKYAMCLCDSPGEYDRDLPSFSFFVEDADVTDEGRPKDDLRGALFLRDPSDPRDPQMLYLDAEYEIYLTPAREAAPTYEPIGRPDPHLREFLVADPDQASMQPFVDLCNGASRGPLDPGVYVLDFMVTDREWFAPRIPVDDGTTGDDGGASAEASDPTGDADDPGNTIPGTPLPGVPDIAAGATFDITTYVFECLEPTHPGCDLQCVGAGGGGDSP